MLVTNQRRAASQLFVGIIVNLECAGEPFILFTLATRRLFVMICFII